MNSASIGAWPADRLETLGRCPLCGSLERAPRHKALADVTFFAAAGHWTLWECEQCGAGYLDPRPDETSITDGYSSYYTHAEGRSMKASNSLRTMVANGYRNWRFGARLRPSIGLGRYIVQFNRGLRRQTETHFRYLPKHRQSDRPVVLDFGCGNGEFLARAETIGWTGFGIEPDESARRLAVLGGFTVAPILESLRTDGLLFDAVTLSHVIEHLHDPLETLRHLRARMKTGATLFIETPNYQSVGHAIYGRHWRGLETPRHLILFNRRNLHAILEAAGFDALQFHPCPGALAFTADQSRKIAAGDDPYGNSAGVGRGPTRHEMRIADETGERSEFLALTCRKSG